MNNQKVYPTESQEQMAIFNWALLQEGIYPELSLMYHIPNEGKRSKYTGARMRREGLKPGVPDICLPVSRGGYYGLYIELKTIKGKPTKLQSQWLEDLKAQNYYAVIAYGFDDAIEIITKYLKARKGEKNGPTI